MADKKWILLPPASSPFLTPPKLRLLCIPHAGSGAHVYHPWFKEIPADVEVLPIELPGRNTRLRDPRPANMRELVSDMLTALEPLFKAKEATSHETDANSNAPPSPPPFAFFGHSLGAWIAFAATQELQARRSSGERDISLPVALFVSGVRAPQLTGVAHDPDGVDMHTIETPVEFWAAMERRYGKNPELEDPGVRKFMLPMLQADFRISETYQPAFGVGELALPCPLFVFGGAQDPRYSAEQLEAWSAWALPQHLQQPPCEIKLFPGGHQYLFKAAESGDQFIATLSAHLRQIAKAAAVAVEKELEAAACELPVSRSAVLAAAVVDGRAGSVHSRRSRDGECCIACDFPSPSPSIEPSEAGATVASGSSYAYTAAAGGKGGLVMGRAGSRGEGDGSRAAMPGSPQRKNWLHCWC